MRALTSLLVGGALLSAGVAYAQDPTIINTLRNSSGVQYTSLPGAETDAISTSGFGGNVTTQPVVSFWTTPNAGGVPGNVLDVTQVQLVVEATGTPTTGALQGEIVPNTSETPGTVSGGVFTFNTAGLQANTPTVVTATANVRITGGVSGSNAYYNLELENTTNSTIDVLGQPYSTLVTNDHFSTTTQYAGLGGTDLIGYSGVAINAQVIPEASSLATLLLGVVPGALFLARRRKQETAGR